MKASIIAVGEEVLRREVTDTNTVFLTNSLSECGIDPDFAIVVGDKEDDILKALEVASGKSDYIITIGGLGPTQDDLTRETVAKFLGLEMVSDPQIIEKIDQRFQMMGLKTPQSNYRQAFVPVGAIPLDNNFGTAPGLMIQKSGKTYIILPGPPRELVPMWENHVLTKIRTPTKTFARNFHVFGLTESETAQRIDNLISSKTQPFVTPYASPGDIRLRVWARAGSKEEFDSLIAQTIQEMESKLSPNLFDNPIEIEVGNALKSASLTISTAESCTGGLIAKTLTDVPGSSAYMMGSAVTYSNDAKMKLLGVLEETLAKHGAVSEETASQMVGGCAKLFGTNCAIATTGIAGPDGGTDTKPVGLVYTGILTPKRKIVYKRIFSGDRNDIRHRTMMFALTKLLLELKGID